MKTEYKYGLGILAIVVLYYVLRAPKITPLAMMTNCDPNLYQEAIIKIGNKKFIHEANKGNVTTDKVGRFDIKIQDLDNTKNKCGNASSAGVVVEVLRNGNLKESKFVLYEDFNKA